MQAVRKRTPRPHLAGRSCLPLVVGFAVLLAVATWTLRPDPTSSPEENPESALRHAREQAAASFSVDARGAAREALRPLLEVDEPAAEDLVRAAIVELSLGELEAGRAFLDRAASLAPDLPEVTYNQGQIELIDGYPERARPYFERTLAALPDDLPTQLALATSLEEEDPERSRALFQGIIDLGVDHSGSWIQTALYRQAQLLRDEGLDELADERLDRYEELLDRGITAPKRVDLERGNLGRLVAPDPVAEPRLPAEPMGKPEPRTANLPEFAGTEGLELADFDDDGTLDVLAYGSSGIVLGRVDSEGAIEPRPLGATGAEWLVTLDLGNDGDVDILVPDQGTLVPWITNLEPRGEDERPDLILAPASLSFPELPAGARGAVPVDMDHEGDLDLLIFGSFGLRLWRNDAVTVEGGRYVDVTEEAGLGGTFDCIQALIEDFDTDGDVDVLAVGDSGVRLFDNLRGGRFLEQSERTAELPAGLRTFAADVDGDGRPDLVYASNDGGTRVSRGQPSGLFQGLDGGNPESGSLEGAAVDLDLDASVDALRLDTRGALQGVLGVGLDESLELPWPLGEGVRAVRSADLDGDLRGELLVLRETGLEIHDLPEVEGTPFLLSIRGVKDNRRAVGAVVELRAGGVYQRRFWDGGIHLLGLGEAEGIDWMRITWPNGVTQYELRQDPGDRRATSSVLDAILQTEGLVGSCPFLYTWDGETYTFISDVLGITPLGLPMAPGMIVPPDHDEYVLVRGHQLAPKDGFLEMQFTEELREVTYLDQVRLLVVDHPEGTEIYPNERFCFPPFPEPHTHTVRAPLVPLRATGSDGKDWTAEVAAIDEVYAAEMEFAPSQFLGLANPHWLELEFDPGQVADAEALRLLMTGWFFWTDASVNIASAGHPEWSFVPPILQVPDGQGGWRDAGPPVGFPAGKTKTMVLDVAGILNPEDPRIRVFHTLRLHWDSIRLAVDGDDAPLEVTTLEPHSARLWRRGFSGTEVCHEPHQPARFLWDQLADIPRWNPHPGLYTRYGEVLPLVEDVDDRYVVMGSGEALHLRFDARELAPPAEGMTRDYLVFLDGWAKDRDPNTHEALHVDPLPFHGMSTYPYGPDESFPDTPEHRAWLREWQTRQPEPWLPDPRAEAIPEFGRGLEGVHPR